MLWSGAIGDIPAGWVLCDGNNSTPDLRNRFVIGAGDTYAVNDTGGNVDHTHSFTGNGHTHVIGGGSDIATGPGFDAISESTQVTGTTNAGSSLPPFYALAYIMKT